LALVRVCDSRRQADVARSAHEMQVRELARRSADVDEQRVGHRWPRQAPLGLRISRESTSIATDAMATVTTILRPGDVLGGFRVDDVIGIGGMAIVYRAEQMSLGRQVALKVLSSKLANDVVFRERFRREGEHAAALEHPNIVPVYYSGEDSGLLYLAMRLVEGTNLAELIERQGLTADRTLAILSPIASALDTAHTAGLIHRDVKPQNVLITSQGHPYLADFGVAKGSNTYGLTATGGFVGSINYASPEQIKGLTLTPASDVYALTAVLYQCLTGSVPYPRETDAGIMHAHLNEPPPTLPVSIRGASDFHDIFAQGMAKDPGARYRQASDLLNAAARSVGHLAPSVRSCVPTFPAEPATETLSAPPAPRTDTELVAPAEVARPSSQAQHTTADRRRAPTPEAEPEAAGSPGRWPRRMAVGIGTVAAVALIVVLLAGGAGTQIHTLRRGFVELAYSKPWHEVAPPSRPIRGLRFENAIALASPSGSLTVGALGGATSIPGSLPPAALADLGAKPRGAVVHLGGIVALAYDGAPDREAQASRILVIPTARGELGLLCTGILTNGSLSVCMQVAEALRIVGVAVVPVGVDRQLAGQLAHSLAPSITARAHTTGLSSPQVSRRAAEARAIADADRRTAKALSQLAPQLRYLTLVGALALAVESEASKLNALADAAAGKNYAAYARAVSGIRTATDQIHSARNALVKVGFTSLPVLSALRLPDLPRVHHASRPVSHVSAPVSASNLETPAPSSTTAPATPSAPVVRTPSAPAPPHKTSPRTEVAKPLS
jgi:serine/threonine protein kinase